MSRDVSPKLGIIKCTSHLPAGTPACCMILGEHTASLVETDSESMDCFASPLFFASVRKTSASRPANFADVRRCYGNPLVSIGVHWYPPYLIYIILYIYILRRWAREIKYGGNPSTPSLSHSNIRLQINDFHHVHKTLSKRHKFKSMTAHPSAQLSIIFPWALNAALLPFLSICVKCPSFRYELWSSHLSFWQAVS